ncbi:S-adenosyl-L-methionine-dependent methyltransferases superfamily protein [Striga hermonthica]|uniref:S-adenosyl-L-methionine-dependent methyltransferases superfamily protein n=1 Tax=Striga hermonthica TaxID=68872 RepID=A0A9N7RRP2_STRHE|nr:S-adenosyl-L-methionine-dependent methyltransferases superfamily protein [Striga hermonthica]
MCEVVEISDDEDDSMPSNDLASMLKHENLDYEFPQENTSSRPMENVASSSGTNLRSSFLGMGFAPALVDKAIEEHGEGNAELVLETLFAYSNHQQPKPEPFDDGLSNSNSDDLTANHHSCPFSRNVTYFLCICLSFLIHSLGFPYFLQLWILQEPDAGSDIDGKKESLLKMNFTADEVELAMGRLGKDATVGQLMDFIFATRMAKKYEKDTPNIIIGDEENEKDCSNEVLFGVMEKTLQLLEMGFSENEISTAFEKCGSEAPLPELTNSIVDPTYQYRPPKRKTVEPLLDSLFIKTEEQGDLTSQVGTSNSLGKSKRKIPRTRLPDEPNDFMEPKEEFAETGSSANLVRIQAQKDNRRTSSASLPPAWQMDFLVEDSKLSMYESTPNPCRTLSPAAARPPYFLYGHVTSLSHSSWAKISQFLYSVKPEFVNTETHSALSRQEGYVHNLPTDNRAHILPRGPLTIQEAAPHSEKWWPAWDTRKHLTHVGYQMGGTTHVIDRVAQALSGSDGPPPQHLVQQLQSKNLIWMGRNRVGPLEPELAERVMGYPPNHTRAAGLGPDERLRSLGLAFQTDTLGYLLSVLRQLCPGGVAVLSFFTGIGGPEVALHRLGIRMRGVVSVEPSEVRRRIVRRWWESSGQGGELVQIEDANRLTGGRLEELTKKFGGFDLVVCQNPSSGAESDVLSGLDFSMFVEFVRVLQRVRSSTR